MASTQHIDHFHRNSRVRIVFPVELQASANQLSQWTLESLHDAETRLQIELRQNVEVYFDTKPLLHNGLSTAVPRNRILVHTEAPDLNSSVGLSRFFLKDTLVHEWGHMLTVQENRGVFKGFSWILGHSSRPNGAWPRWIHEGIAVWTEKIYGGRPLSGSIDFDLRRYAEYSTRVGRAALESSHLDGQWELASFRPGQVPYSFGYLLISHLEKNHAFSPGHFAKTSARSLGLSFRKSFQESGISIDTAFNEAREEWAKTPLHTKDSPATLVATEYEIRGLQRLEDWVSWIEEANNAKPKLVAHKESRVRQRIWPFDLLRPLQVWHLDDGEDSERWALLVETVPQWLQNSIHSPTSPMRRRLILFDGGAASFHCVFELGDRLRELKLHKNTLLWTKSLEEGQYEILEASWDRDCKLGEAQSLVSSGPFERLSSPSRFGQDVFFTQNFPSQTRFDEKIMDSRGRYLQDTGSTHTSGLIQFERVSASLALAFERTPTYWGPLVLRGSESFEAYRLPLRTGAYEAVISADERIYYIEKLWDRDEVRRIAIGDPSLRAATTLALREFRAEKADSRPTPMVEVVDAVSSSPHSPIDDIWPHFWIPSLLVSEGAWVIGGQTFYSDLTNTWSGASFLGYNSQIQRPFGSTSLNWVPSHRAPWPQLNLYADYTPRDVSFFDIPGGQNVQERSSGGLALSVPFALQSRWRGHFSVGYSLRHSGGLGRFEGSTNSAPFLRLNLRSPYGRRPYATLTRLSSLPSFFFFEQRARWLLYPELQSDLYGLLKTTPNTRLLLALEGAHTEPGNFPQSYFVWGGTLPLSSFHDGIYLNRGFPAQGFIAQRLLRLSGEWIWGIWTPRSSMSWNRFRVQSLDLRLVAESVTWSSFFTPNYRIGHQYSSSLGAEVDILGSALHYVGYKLSLGAFHGIGDFSEMRYTAQFRMGLDL
jgi:hypothetical protein